MRRRRGAMDGRGRAQNRRREQQCHYYAMLGSDHGSGFVHMAPSRPTTKNPNQTSLQPTPTPLGPTTELAARTLANEPVLLQHPPLDTDEPVVSAELVSKPETVPHHRPTDRFPDGSVQVLHG